MVLATVSVTVLLAAPEEKVRLSPNLARIYRERVESLQQVLRDPQHGREAFELIRSLIEEVRLLAADGQLGIELKGELAGILTLADGAKRAAAPYQEKALQIKMVAGARSHLYRTDIRIGSRGSSGRRLRASALDRSAVTMLGARELA